MHRSQAMLGKSHLMILLGMYYTRVWATLARGRAPAASRRASSHNRLSLISLATWSNPHVHTFNPPNRGPYVTASLAETRPICHSSHYTLADTMASLASLLGLCHGISPLHSLPLPSAVSPPIASHPVALQENVPLLVASSSSVVSTLLADIRT
jgi:hypothetical protein